MPDTATADAERKPQNDAPKKDAPPPEGAGATPTAPSNDAAAPAPGGGLGEKEVKKKSAPGAPEVGKADDPEEKEADAQADKVMRMAAPAEEPAEKDAKQAPPTPDPARSPEVPASEVEGGGEPTTDEPTTDDKVRRQPATGARPDAVTPAGPAPLIGRDGGGGGKGKGASAETGTPAPPSEPPAPEGEQPARGTPEVPPEVQEYLGASRGKGMPMPEATRKEFEAKYERSFADVRIHDDAASDDAAKKLDALAFTRGSDIYFRAGSFDPASDAGKSLLAHELAHVVQQRPGVNRKMIRRRAPSGSGGGTGGGGSTGGGPSGTIDIASHKITIDELKVPKFKADKKSKPLIIRKGTREENPTKQASEWRKHARPKTSKAVEDKIAALKTGTAQTGDPAWYLQLLTREFFLIGKSTVIASDNRVPPWDKKGDARSFDIDHKQEAQIGGDDNIANMWLLDSAKNRSAGSTIRTNIDAALRSFLTKTAPDQAGIDKSKIPSEAEARKDPWTVEFKEMKGEGADAAPEDFWEVGELETKLMEHFKMADAKTVEKLRGSPENLRIYGRASGGGAKDIERTGDVTPIKGWQSEPAGAFQFTEVNFTEDNAKGNGQGSLSGMAFKDGKIGEPKPFSVPIKPLKGVSWGGVVAPGSINYWSAKAFSPIQFPEVEFDPRRGFLARGLVPKPSIKLLEDVQIAVVLDGNVGIEATVYGGDLKLPGPFKVKGGSLTLGVGTGGITARGDIFFSIEKLAEGRIGAAASMKGGGATSFDLEGELKFDTKMFKRAEVKVSYKDGKWGGEGDLEVAKDAIKGIKSAKAHVSVKDDKLDASGEFETSIKGVKKGTVGLKYAEATGMEITGAIELGDMPGVKSGKVDATVKEGANGWTLSGGVTIVPSIPGVAASITGRYEDGAFDVTGAIAYERGIAKGSLTIGVTNATVGDDGKPSGPPQPDGAITAYGQGSVTLTITPWLKGTVGLKLKPNGEIEVSGEVALPSSFEVFPEKKVEKQLVSIGLDIPIVGVAVAGQRIGIFATIRGGVSISAGFGPGQLKDVALRVTYNPDHPDDTTVTGTGTFYVPANAGLRLSVDGGIGAGIPVVSATAGVSIYGEIGVQGAASASATVNWTPVAGIVMDAKGELSVQPKFKFGIDAFVEVTADLLLTTIELYKKKWKLASFEYGSNLTFGLVFPIHYESGKPFDISFDQVEWKYPDIDPGELLPGLMKQLVG